MISQAFFILFRLVVGIFSPGEDPMLYEDTELMLYEDLEPMIFEQAIP